MSNLGQSLRLIAAVPAACLLAACQFNGIGSGNTLSTVEIRRLSAIVDPDSNLSYVCFKDQLQLVGTFDDGAQADYTYRGTWTSSDPTVVKVSNGDLAETGDATKLFGPGIIVPIKPGEADITASFVGKQASYHVKVERLDPSTISINTANARLYPGSFRNLALTLTVPPGYKRDVTNVANWSLVDGNGADVDSSIALIGNYDPTGNQVAGRITSLAVSGPLTASATFPECRDASGNSTPLTLSAAVQVDDQATLTVAREPGFPTDGKLAAGTNEAIQATATFAADGSTQDLTGQAFLSSDNEDAIATNLIFRAFATAGGTTGTGTGTASVTAYYGDPDPAAAPLTSSNSISLESVAGYVDSFEITPANAVVDAFSSTEYTVLGHLTYTPNGGTGTAMLDQPITRSINWGVTDAADETTNEYGITADATLSKRLGVSNSPNAGQYTLTATLPSTATIANSLSLTPATTLVCVQVPGTTGTTCP